MIKTILYYLLVGLVLSQITLDQAVTTVSKDFTLLEDGYQTIPIDNLTQIHEILKDGLEFTFPTIENWTLVDVKENIDNQTAETIIIYTYFQLEESQDGMTAIVTDYEMFVVIGDEEGNLFTIYLGDKAVRTFNLEQETFWDHQEEKKPEPKENLQLAAGETKTLNINNLDSSATKAEQFVRANVPQLENWTLANVLAEGQQKPAKSIKYCLTYQKKQGQTKTYQKYCVISQPQNNNYLQMTLSSGKKLTSGGKPAQNNQENNN